MNKLEINNRGGNFRIYLGDQCPWTNTPEGPDWKIAKSRYYFAFLVEHDSDLHFSIEDDE
jgi:hypothetical protein